MTDEEFSRIVKYTAVRYGINLYHKKVMVEGRLSNYLAANGFKSYTEYMDRVEADYTVNGVEVAAKIRRRSFIRTPSTW